MKLTSSLEIRVIAETRDKTVNFTARILAYLIPESYRCVVKEHTFNI